MKWVVTLERYGRRWPRGFWFGPFRVFWHGRAAMYLRPRYGNYWAEGRVIAIAWLGFEFDYSYLHSPALRFRK